MSAPPSSLGRRALLGAALLAGFARARAAEGQAAAAERAFAEAGIGAGCFALRELASGKLTLVHAGRAGRRFAPASTFKIPNTLIALQAGAVKDAQESGWLFDTRPQLGWWVGWTEGEIGAAHSFALNMDMGGAEDAPKRERIARRLLALFGVFPAKATPS